MTPSSHISLDNLSGRSRIFEKTTCSIRPLGIAAAVGVVAYFCAAVWMHLRARQYDLAGPILFLALSGATLALSVYAAA